MATLAPPAIDSNDLTSILQTYNAVTERLKQSHDALAREVCRLREKLLEQDKELERRERLASLGRMAAGVAHEIRNPLGGIGLYASLLDRDLADRPAQRDLVRKLSAGIRNVESIVSDILAFAGDGEPKRRRISLGEVLDAVVFQTEPHATQIGVRLVVEESLTERTVFCDGAQIERALINLVLNAIDGAGSGGRVWVRSAKAKGDRSRFGVVVEDDGPGIRPEHMQRIFDPFFTTKDNGTGLGLAIVHRIAESNGGAVTAASRDGGGAAFVLWIPRFQDRVLGDLSGGLE